MWWSVEEASSFDRDPFTESEEIPRGRPVALASRERKLLTFCCPFGDHDLRRSHSLMLPAEWGSGFRVGGEVLAFRVQG